MTNSLIPSALVHIYRPIGLTGYMACLRIPQEELIQNDLTKFIFPDPSAVFTSLKMTLLDFNVSFTSSSIPAEFRQYAEDDRRGVYRSNSVSTAAPWKCLTIWIQEKWESAAARKFLLQFFRMLIIMENYKEYFIQTKVESSRWGERVVTELNWYNFFSTYSSVIESSDHVLDTDDITEMLEGLREINVTCMQDFWHFLEILSSSVHSTHHIYSEYVKFKKKELEKNAQD